MQFLYIELTILKNSDGKPKNEAWNQRGLLSTLGSVCNEHRDGNWSIDLPNLAITNCRAKLHFALRNWRLLTAQLCQLQNTVPLSSITEKTKEYSPQLISYLPHHMTNRKNPTYRVLFLCSSIQGFFPVSWQVIHLINCWKNPLFTLSFLATTYALSPWS